MYEFKLYVSKATARVESDIKALHCILSKTLNKNYLLKVINVVEQPDEAVKDNICMTPTLVKISPSPMRKIIGDVSKLEMVMDRLI